MLIETLQKEFLIERKYEVLKETILSSYEVFFKSWNQWLNEQGIEQLEDISSRTIKQFLFYCTEIGNKPKTVNTKLKWLRVFSHWIVDEGLSKEQFTKGITAQREDQTPKLVATDDVQLALSHLRRVRRREDTFTSRRNYTLPLFLIGTGLRLGELERLTWNDIDFQERIITINISKSRNAQSVPLSESLAKELLDWKNYIENKLDKLPEVLFVTREGKPFSYNGIQNMFKRLKKKLNIQSDFSPHALRAYFLNYINLLNSLFLNKDFISICRNMYKEVIREGILCPF